MDSQFLRQSTRRDSLQSLGEIEVTQTEKVFTALLIAGDVGATDEELQEMTLIPRRTSVIARRNKLCKTVLPNGDMLVEIAGVRIGSSGKNNVAWRVNTAYHHPGDMFR